MPGRKESIFLREWQIIGGRGKKGVERVLFQTWNQYALSNPSQIVYAHVIKARVNLLGMHTQVPKMYAYFNKIIIRIIYR